MILVDTNIIIDYWKDPDDKMTNLEKCLTNYGKQV